MVQKDRDYLAYKGSGFYSEEREEGREEWRKRY